MPTVPTPSPAAPPAAAAPAVPMRDTLLVLVVAAIAYGSLAQGTLYKGDAHLYLPPVLYWFELPGFFHEPELAHPHHLAYKPALAAAYAALRPLGVSIHGTAVALSALGTALGVALAHRASAGLGLLRGRCLLAAALVGTCMPVAFFATVAELHGPFLAGAGVAFVAAAHVTRRPTLPAAALLGVSTALAHALHASGNLLLLVLAPVVCTWAPAQPWRRWLALAAAAAAAHAAGVVAEGQIARALDLHTTLAEAVGYVSDTLVQYGSDAGRWWSTLWHEWLWPYLPMNALALWAAVSGRGAERRLGSLLHLAVVPFVVVCVFLLPSAESGAYLVPFAWPLALLAARWRPAWLGVAMAAAAAAAASVCIARHDRPQAAAAWADGARIAAATEAEPALLLGDHAGVAAWLTAMPDAPQVLVVYHAGHPLAALPAVVDWLRDWIAARWAEGRAVLLPQGTVDLLERCPPLGPELVAALRQELRMQPVAAGGFRGFRVVRR